MSKWMTILVLAMGMFGSIYAIPQFNNATAFALDETLRQVPEDLVKTARGVAIGELECFDPDYPNDILAIRIIKDITFLEADVFPGAEAYARIKIIKILDYEESTDQNAFAVEIECYSLSNSDRRASFQSRLILLDVNDVAPVFVKGSRDVYEFPLDEDLGPVSLPVMVYDNIKVVDNDGTLANQDVEAVCEDMQAGPITIPCDGFFELRTVRTGPGVYTFQVWTLRNRFFDTNYVLNIYALNVPQADGRGETQTSPKQNVAIRINDIQNMPPAIPIDSIQFTISESQLPEAFGTVRAFDQDRGDPHNINFTLAINNEEPYGFEQDFFELGEAYQQDDGVWAASLKLKRQIDREAIPGNSDIVYVTLIAQEYDPLGRPNRNEMSATAIISVEVTDINDVAPMFTPDTYTVQVPEATGNIPPEQANDRQQLLANLAVIDRDSNRFNSFVLEIVSGNEQGIFSLDRYNGSRNEGFIMYIKKGALDFEANTQNQHRVVIKATDIGRSDLTSTAIVEVDILDVNDNTPAFERDVYSFNLPENSDLGTFIGSVVATDGDQGDTVTYGLQGDPIFYIDNNGGIYLNGSVDFEARSSYQVSVTATDSANQQEQITVTIVIINVNDVGPRFPASGYASFLFEESTELNPPIVILASSAETGELIRYGLESVSPPGLDGYFALDPISGRLTLLRFIDYKQTDNGIILLTFSATAGDLKSTTVGTISVQDINNYAPEFQPNNTNIYYTSTTELAQPGDSIYQMSVIDRDGPETDYGKVFFEIIQGSYDNFIIGFESGTVMVAANAKLDKDETNIYNLVIKARDNGNPLKSSTATLVINLIDANNKPPTFEESVIVTTVKEGTNIGSEIVTVTATDPDQDAVLQYSLSFTSATFSRQSENVTGFIDGNEFFGITNQGRLQVAGNIQRGVFDRVTFKIIAEDTNITIGQPRQTATVDIRVTVLASDEQRIYFNTIKGVEINPTLTKDFSETPLGQSVAQIFSLRAIDPAVSREIKIYREAEGYDPLDYLRVSESYVLLKKELDYEALPGGPAKNLTTVVLAISDDRQRTGTATVIINVLDINDNAPVFEELSYVMTVDEDKPSPSRIGSVKATDADSSSYGQVSYELSGPNSDDFQIFTENSGSSRIGVIRIAFNRTLDYETTPQYNLQAIARDNFSGLSSDRLRASVSVTINVNDKNDNAPIFREDEYYFTVVSTSEIKSSIGVVIADDLDKGQNGNVEYYIQSSTNSGTSYFSIKTKAEKAAEPGKTFNVGDLYVRNSLTNLPEGIRYEMMVVARDNAAGTTQLTSQVPVYITVSTGAQDPKPIWDTNLNSTVNILENSPVGTFVADITARPANSTSSIRYKFVTSGNNFGDWQKFNIDPNTGRVTVNGDLDYEQQTVYSDFGEGYVRNMDLLILATDTANATLTNQFLLVVKIVDVDDNLPSFTSCPDRTYPIPEVTTVLETLEAPVFVYQAKACDLDTDAYNKMQYSWYYDDTYCDPSTARVFSLNGDDGKIHTKIMLDRETTPEYLLCIQVDKKPVAAGRRKRSMVTDLRARDNHDTVLYVRVIVEDVNDNGASFRDPFLQTVMLEYPQVSVAVSEAEDRDLPPNNGIRYSIDSITFTIDGKSQSQPAAFSINGDDGTIVIGQNDYSDFSGGYFEIVVRASDLYNGDLFDRQVQKIYVTNKVNQIRVVFDEPADQGVQLKANNMVNELNALDRGFYQIKKISYHIIDNDQDPSFDKTDVCMVIMRYDNVLSATDGAKELNQQEEFRIIRKYGARDPGPCEPAKSVYPEGWESYWWVLVAFAIFIFILVLILIILICVLHRQYKRYMDTRRTYLVPGN